jgi:uncharacterized repeat protein (TIGR03803 family)
MRPRLIYVCIFLLASVMGVRGATYKTLHNFSTDGPDGNSPIAGLVFDRAGNLYGVAAYGGGDYTDGLVFKLSPSPSGWVFDVVYPFDFNPFDPDFSNPIGREPLAGVIVDDAGIIYGTNSYSDDEFQCGTVFELSPSGSFPLHTFTGPDGCVPQSNLLLSSGWLVGTTSGGGASGQGTVFFVDTLTGTFYSYSLRKTAGTSPSGGFNIFYYGVTRSGGGLGQGNIYRLGPHGLINTFSFSSSRLAGYAPMGDLLTAYVNGVRTMYGVNAAGGKGGAGTVYSLSENQDKPEHWLLKVLHSFSGADGRSPMAGLASDANGNLYGTTWEGGEFNCGTVFKLTPRLNNWWKFSVVYSFNPNNPNSGGDGCHPSGSVVLDAAGNIYGTTEYGGWEGWGTVYEITP